MLSRIAPSSVVRLNRAIAVSMVHGPQAALDLIAPLTGSRRALGLCRLEPERRVLLRRIAELEDK